MTKEFAIALLKQDIQNSKQNISYRHNEVGIEALQLAIKALEQQPCEDCVSRKTIQKAIKDMLLWINSGNRGNTDYFIVDKVEEIIKQLDVDSLPSVTPQRKRGKWIAPNTSPSLMMMGIRLCSECNYETQEAGKFCTNCGADMRGDTDE